jgi:tRNA(fMet)-specific endonuclease VapC
MGQLCLSSITLAELHYGAHRSSKTAHNLAVIKDFCKHLEVVPFDESASVVYGEIRTDLQGRGVLIGPNDMLIAAHAMALGLVIVTNNGKEFSRVKGLMCENWLEEKGT